MIFNPHTLYSSSNPMCSTHLQLNDMHKKHLYPSEFIKVMHAYFAFMSGSCPLQSSHDTLKSTLIIQTRKSLSRALCCYIINHLPVMLHTPHNRWTLLFISNIPLPFKVHPLSSFSFVLKK